MSPANNNSLGQASLHLTAGPSEPELIFGWPDVTYGALYDLAAGLRKALYQTVSATGKKDRPVCLCTTDRVTTAAALLAGLAGGPPLVMPHAHSETVLADLYRLTGFKYAIADRPCSLPPGTRQIDVTAVETGGEDVGSYPPLDPKAPWVHLFTGGSTGTPRLWTKTVHNLLGEATYLQKMFIFSSDDRVLTTSPPYHIYGLLYTVLVPLLANAAVLSTTPAFPAELAAAIKTDGPTVLVTVPAHYRALRNHLPDKSRLRMAFSSASPLADNDADTFSLATTVPIYDVYGSTETGGIACRCRAAGETGFTPFTRVETQIHSERLWVRSPFLSPQLPQNDRGYFEAADRVADRPDGAFTVIGRADGVVKVGGKRVDLAEVRSRLLELAGVHEALVFSRPIATGRGNEILALLETDRTKAGIRSELEHTLPPHARPRAIRTVAKMPITHTGKYDREVIDRLF